MNVGERAWDLVMWKNIPLKEPEDEVMVHRLFRETLPNRVIDHMTRFHLSTAIWEPSAVQDHGIVRQCVGLADRGPPAVGVWHQPLEQR